MAQLNIPSRCESSWYFGIESVSETDRGHRDEVGHGTRIAEAVRATYRGHDRVMIFTDMQTFPDRSGWGGHAGDVSASVPARIPVYGFNLVGYRHSAMPAGHGNRHELGGLTEATFALIPDIEAGLAARWPWVEAAEVQ
jgi:hypothetical protein